MAKRSKKSARGITFVSGFVFAQGIVWILAENERMARAGQAHTLYLKYSSGELSHHTLDHASVTILSSGTPRKRECMIVGLDGEITRLTLDGVKREHVDRSAVGPATAGPIRDARRIGDSIHAVGMSRQCYRRTKAGKWSRIDERIRARPGEVVGFNAITGTASDDLLAVGLQGEIWRFDGASWRQVKSPTDLSLDAAIVASDGSILVCGAAGTVLRGRNGRFKPVAQDVTDDNLYGLAEFAGHTFLASQTGIFRLGKTLEPVDTGLGPITSGHLHANDGVLWSFGAHHLLVTRDGIAWEQIVLPQG